MKRTMKKGRTILGIEVTTAEILVVEMEGAWPEPRILKADSIETPPDSMSGSEIVRPDLVGKALSTLLARMAVRTRNAVIGVPSGAVATRVLDIPNIPEPELRQVVQGEVSHQNILPNSQGEFDYLRLDTGEVKPQNRPRLLLMAAEGRILDSYHKAAGVAGVNVVGMEPGLIALYRAGSALAYSRPPCLSLMIGSALSEIVIMDHGPIRVYRRLDLGSHQLLAEKENPEPTQSFAEVPTFEMPAVRYNLDGSLAADSGRTAVGIADNNALNSLTVELQRSLDYYNREYPDAPPVGTIVIVATRPELNSLAEWISDKLQIETAMATLPTAGIADPAVRSRLEEPASVRFLRASGLAMQGLEKLPEGLPEFNLLGKRKAERAASAISGRMAFALAASILILLFGSINMFRTAQQANHLDHQLDHAKADRETLRIYHGLPLDEVRRQKDILNILLPVGEPLPGVVDAMAGAVPPDASLGEISREKPGIVSLTGETSNDAVLVQFLDALRQLPSCVKVSLDSLNRNNNVSNGIVGKAETLHYQITAQIRPTP